MNTVKIENLTIGYKNHIVAERLSATVYSGEMTCLIGRNGLGKSTLLRTIAGFQPALGGKVVLNIDDRHYDVASTSKALLSRLVSIVLTDKVDISNMTVFDIVAMGRMPYTNFFGVLKDDDRHIVDEAMLMTGISMFSKRDISSLSDGERQKVMIARALAQQTPVIILDEPTAFLDYPSKIDTMRLLQKMAHDMQKIVLVSTHDIDIANRFTDNMLTINHQGRLEKIEKNLQTFC